MNCGIYKIENEIDGTVYIGQSVNIPSRWRQHLVNYLNTNEATYESHLYRAFRRYGIENFSFKIIEFCKQDELDNREIYWIKYYDSYENGYNEDYGGHSHCKVDRDKFFEYYEKTQCSVGELAKMFGIERTVAGRILKERVETAKYYVSKNEEKEICEDYLSDRSMSCSKLSKKYGRDSETISRVLKRNNIDVLPSGSPKSKKIWVYDFKTNELLYETYIKDFCQFLKDNRIVENANISTIQNHVKRKGIKLYGKYRIRDYKE